MVQLHSSQISQHNVLPAGMMAMPLPVVESLPEVHMIEAGHTERSELERYIHDRFALEYGADINKFMPHLMKFSSNIQTYAALGFRPASNARLFLESYLKQPVEIELAEITGLDIDRNKIVEAGNLAGTKPGSSAPALGAICCFLERVGYEWGIVCATPSALNVFSKLQIPLIGLAEANESALPDDQKALWGTYYQTKPLVMAVHIKTANRCINESVIGKRLMGMLYPSINTMVDEWRQRHV